MMGTLVVEDKPDEQFVSRHITTMRTTGYTSVEVKKKPCFVRMIFHDAAAPLAATTTKEGTASVFLCLETRIFRWNNSVKLQNFRTESYGK